MDSGDSSIVLEFPVHCEHELPMDLSLQSATRIWDDLADMVERFLAAWADGQPPSLADYPPSEPAEVRRLALVELVKVDLEHRASRGLWKGLDEYVSEFPELAVNGEPSVELIYEDYHWCREAGRVDGPSAWFARYPHNAERLQQLLQLRPQVGNNWNDGKSHKDLRAGERVDDFELMLQLGRGAFATVFLARQCSLQRLVALKVSADRSAEPQTLAQLDHPHIIRVYDQRLMPAEKWRLLYMQFAPGGTLQEVVARAQVLPPSQRSGKILIDAIEHSAQRSGQGLTDSATMRRRWNQMSWPETVCRLGVALAQALDYAHRQGILHRDIKPANVLLASDGSPMLADFNISFAAGLPQATAAAYFGGSLAYMSPEQLEASHPERWRHPEELDGRSDIYSLAVMLWELLHGERPFRDERLECTWAETVAAMLDRRKANRIDQPVNASDERMAARIRQVLRRSLSAERDERPPDGNVLARELYLCTQPQAWELLRGTKSRWRTLVRSHPLALLTAAVLPPNILGAAFNYWYNKQAIIDPLGAMAENAFWWVPLIVNGIAFSLGILLLLVVASPLVRTLKQLGEVPGPDSARLSLARRRALRFGHVAAAVGIVEWLAAGILFPLCMDLALDDFPAIAYVHFFFSMVVCGAVAAAFPFFGATELGLRVFYPALLGQETVDESERRELTGIARHSIAYLMAAVGVPLLGLLLLTGSGSTNRPAALLLIGAGLGGMIVAFLAHNRIRAQALALAAATRPVETAAFESESIDF